MPRDADQLWELTRHPGQIDALALSVAVEQAADEDNDFRTRVLIRDSVRALTDNWGSERTLAWIAASSNRASI